MKIEMMRKSAGSEWTHLSSFKSAKLEDAKLSAVTAALMQPEPVRLRVLDDRDEPLLAWSAATGWFRANLGKADRTLALVAELALEGRITDKGIFVEDCERIRAVTEEPDQAELEVLPQNAELRAALIDACEQLEGWVAWKCPAKHRLEHVGYIARLRALAGDSTAEVDLPDVADMEVLVWRKPTETPFDPETEVLVHFRMYGLRMASWDPELQAWMNENGQPIGDEALAWAGPRGVR